MLKCSVVLHPKNTHKYQDVRTSGNV